MASKILSASILASILACLMPATAPADTLILKDGRVLQGKFMGGDPDKVRFAVDGPEIRLQRSAQVPSSAQSSTARKAPERAQQPAGPWRC